MSQWCIVMLQYYGQAQTNVNLTLLAWYNMLFKDNWLFGIDFEIWQVLCIKILNIWNLCMYLKCRLWQTAQFVSSNGHGKLVWQIPVTVFHRNWRIFQLHYHICCIAELPGGDHKCFKDASSVGFTVGYMMCLHNEYELLKVSVPHFEYRDRVAWAIFIANISVFIANHYHPQVLASGCCLSS